jgi:hypothetical protein
VELAVPGGLPARRRSALRPMFVQLKESETMKSLVCNVFGMALVTACLILFWNRPAPADEGQAAEKTVTATVVAKALETGDEDEHGVAITIAGKADGADAKGKTITVDIQEGTILVNGKPVKIPALKLLKAAKIDVNAALDEKTGELRLDVDAEGKKQDKKRQIKVLLMKQDGEVQTLDIDESATWHEGEASARTGDKAQGSQEQVYTIVVGDGGQEVKKQAQQIRVRAIKVEPGQVQKEIEIQEVAPGKLLVQPMPHPMFNAEVTKRLRGIEKELKQIRKLLEEMREDDD